MTVQQEVDAAEQDPLIQQRHANFMRNLEQDPSNAADPQWPGFPYNRKVADDLAALYAVHYPLAGLEWIFTFDDPRYPSRNLLIAFVMQLQESKPGLGLKLLEHIDAPERKIDFADALGWHSRGKDFDVIWEHLLDPSNQVVGEGKLRDVKRNLIGAQARNDPDGAWERFRSQLPESGDEVDFLAIPWGRLDAGTSYPVRFLDRVLAGGHDVSPSVESAIWHCTTPENIVSIESWLEQNQDEFDSKPACMELGRWWLYSAKNIAASEFWNSRAN